MTEDQVRTEIARLRAQLAAVEHWVDDLQSGMFINCVYCGFRYGPGSIHAESLDDPKATASMRDALTAHVQQCPKHPLAAAEQRVAALEKLLVSAAHALRSYQYGNSATDLAEEVADALDAALRPPPGGA